MGAVFKNESFRIPINPSAKLDCGTVVYVNGLVGVATRTIDANSYGEIQLVGEYDVDVSSVTANQGEIVTVAAKTLSGVSTTCKFGPALTAITSSDTVARLRLNCMANFGLSTTAGNNIVKLTDNSGGTAADTIPAAASTAYTKAETDNAIASLADKINDIIDSLVAAGIIKQAATS